MHVRRGDLDAGDALSLPFPVDTDPSAIDPATLDGTIADDGSNGPDANLTNNDDDETIAPTPVAELAIDVTVTVDPVTSVIRSSSPSPSRTSDHRRPRRRLRSSMSLPVSAVRRPPPGAHPWARTPGTATSETLPPVRLRPS